MRKRVVSRTAQIYYLQARQLETVGLYDYEFTKYDQRPLRRDMAHILIAALTSIVDEEHVMQQNTERAMQLCVKNLFESTSAGAQHDALGFRIAHAHLLRKKEMIKAADECLDGVHRDIYMYGCSERTYLSFLLEAGRNLLTRKNGPRAYCIYFVPCLERAMARSLTREAQQARGYALQALRQIGQLYDGAPENPDAVSIYIEAKISEGTFIETDMRPTVVDGVSQDPLASYDINDDFERVFSLIRSPDAVAAEIKQLDNLKLE
ncbi:hypothetical protein MMA231_03986 (plasmid) [Asticcacaulis sp. MM231]|uniref:hypothetical protein n=1 Tax=Asticcacaulis sp. MM231 TaxID=3157666 RepID=UPI0032D5AB41